MRLTLAVRVISNFHTTLSWTVWFISPDTCYYGEQTSCYKNRAGLQATLLVVRMVIPLLSRCAIHCPRTGYPGLCQFGRHAISKLADNTSHLLNVPYLWVLSHLGTPFTMITIEGSHHFALYAWQSSRSVRWPVILLSVCNRTHEHAKMGIHYAGCLWAIYRVLTLQAVHWWPLS